MINVGLGVAGVMLKSLTASFFVMVVDPVAEKFPAVMTKNTTMYVRPPNNAIGTDATLPRKTTDAPVEVVGEYKLTENGQSKDYYLVNTGKTVKSGLRWMFVLKADVKKWIDPGAFPTDMTGYTKGTKSQYAAMGIGYFSSNADLSYINSQYGPRPKLTQAPQHIGIDVRLKGDKDPTSTPVIAVASGKVVYRSMDTSSMHGNCIAIESDLIDPATGNNIRFIYMHLRNAPLFDNRDPVKKGDVLGYAGATGQGITGPHLHFEAYNNTTNLSGNDYAGRINPTYFYPNKSFTTNTDSYHSDYIGSNDPNVLLNYDIDPKYKK